MQMRGEERIAAPQARVWEGLNDPAVLRQCIPGCQSLERESDGRLRATVEVKIGPIGARFNGAVTLSDIDAPHGYTITGEGQGGTVGHARGGAKVRLTDDGAGGTMLSYEVNAEVGGRLAQLGGPIIDATAKQLAAKFFRKFGEVVGGAVAPEVVSSSPSSSAIPERLVIAPPVGSAVGSATVFPWGWLLSVIAAIITGYLLGRSTVADWWVIGLVILVILTASAGYESGRRGGRQ